MTTTIRMTCPRTGTDVSTGIVIDPVTFKGLIENGSQVRCPACGQVHAWPKDARLTPTPDVMSEVLGVPPRR